MIVRQEFWLFMLFQSCYNFENCLKIFKYSKKCRRKYYIMSCAMPDSIRECDSPSSVIFDA